MSEGRSAGFTGGSVPEAYDRFMAPQLFEPWARELVGRAKLRSGSSVLDVASGPGTVARLAAAVVGLDGRVVASDISPAMLALAAAKPVDPAWAPIDYLECPVSAIDAAEGSFDAVLCQQGLQFFPDRGRAVGEMRRLARPGGVVMVSTWASERPLGLFGPMTEALQEAGMAEPYPYAFDPRSYTLGAAELRRLLSGLRDLVVETVVLDAVWRNAEDAAATLMGTPYGPGMARSVGAAGVCHGVWVGEDMWDAYDQMGLSFQQHAADSAYNAHYDRPAVLAALGPVAGRRVLDAACGPGLYLRELLERGAEVTAFDASPVMVSLARQRTAGRVQIDQAVLGESLPYPDRAFDLVVCALAIHYASDRAAAFAEFFRVLRPGGAAVVSTQHPVMDWLRKGGSYFQGALETDIWHTPSGNQPVHFWREPLSALCAAATDAGFLIEKLIEPVPAETMRERYPEDYEKLSKEPGFLILRLRRLARPNPSPAN